jgi:hypothetical protein
MGPELSNLLDADESGLDAVNAKGSEPGPSHDRDLISESGQSKLQSESCHGKDHQAVPDSDPGSPELELGSKQLEQVLAADLEGCSDPELSDSESDPEFGLEGGWDSDLDPYSESEESVELDNLEDDMELFDMFGDTQVMEFTSYD